MGACKIFRPPEPFQLTTSKSVFLAGTIDNGNSEDWQTRVENLLSEFDCTVLNPRRKEWDHTWDQSIDNPEFRQQVEWELDGMECADIVFMYFAPGSQSPITLLELGLLATSNKLIIVAPPGFWRRGNIEVVAKRYSISAFDSLEEGLIELKHKVR